MEHLVTQQPAVPANIQGSVDPRFAGLREAFASCFAEGLERGGAVAVVVDGKLVADLWGGYADQGRTRLWQRDTLVNVWSSTKGIMALAIGMLADRGKLAYDRPVAEYWPAFAAGGKEAITLDLALSHQAGLDGLAVHMDLDGLYAWDPYVNALAAMAPHWQPGSRCVYHAISLGHLAGEPLRRIDGRRVGKFIAEEIAGPLGVPFFIGLPASEDHRVAELIEGPKTADWVARVLASPYPSSCRNPSLRPTEPNHRAWRTAEIPGANGQADARALATIYGSLVGADPPLISRHGLTDATRPRFDGVDASDGTPAAYGAGFRLKDPCYGAKASRSTFGHTGWGGTLAFADPDARLGFAYVTSHMLGFDDGVDPRRQRLVEAVYDAL
jgi:CubicO group peptidase (beta-lactamase class C family)